MKLLKVNEINWETCPVGGYAIKEWLAEQPTVEAEPLHQGEWIPFSDDDQDEGLFLCSTCKDVQYMGEDVFTSKDASTVFHYCPNCGTKMNGGELLGGFIVPPNFEDVVNQEQQNPMECKSLNKSNKLENIKIIHSKDKAYDIYNGDTDEYIMTRCSADNIFSFLSEYDSVKIEFIDKTITP